MSSSRSRKTPKSKSPSDTKDALNDFIKTILLQSYDPNYVSPSDNDNELRTPLELARVLAESARKHQEESEQLLDQAENEVFSENIQAYYKNLKKQYEEREKARKKREEREAREAESSRFRSILDNPSTRGSMLSLTSRRHRHGNKSPHSRSHTNPGKDGRQSNIGGKSRRIFRRKNSSRRRLRRSTRSEHKH